MPPSGSSGSSYNHNNDGNRATLHRPLATAELHLGFLQYIYVSGNPFSINEQGRLSQIFDGDLKRVRDEEGILDLEEINQREEERNACQGMDCRSGYAGVDLIPNRTDPEEKIPIVNAGIAGKIVLEQKAEVGKVVNNEIIPGSNGLAVLDTQKARNLIEVMKDIEDQFTGVYDLGKKVWRMPKARKANYHSSFTELKDQIPGLIDPPSWVGSRGAPRELK